MEVLAREFRQEEEIKGIHIRKEEVELSLFIADVILYIEYPKDSTRKLLEIISEFSKLAGFKSVAFYTLKTRKLRKQVHLQFHQKIKHLGINLTKEMKIPVHQKL